MVAGWDDYVDESWLGRIQEPIVDPAQPIIDPHHHLWEQLFPYGRSKLADDLASGHNIAASVYMEAGNYYSSDGPEHLRSVGETRYMAGIAEEGWPDGRAVMAGIIGHGDLCADRVKVDEMLAAHAEAGRGRFRGLRVNILSDFDMDTFRMIPASGWEEMIEDKRFRAGVARLANGGFSLDLMCGYEQLVHVGKLAASFPDLTIVLNHLASVVHPDRSETSEEAKMAAWRREVDKIYGLPNLYMKLGGLTNPMAGWWVEAMARIRKEDKPPTSDRLAEAYRPFISHAVETLGPARCMFESNFPIDKTFTSYSVLWNAFKKLAAPYSSDERHKLLMGTAQRAYRLAGPSI